MDSGGDDFTFTDRTASSLTLPLVFNEGASLVMAGEVKVCDPQTHGSNVNRYTAYLVKGIVGSDRFESRKRYSDFEWLRKTLVSQYPGIRLPQLPKKQKHGRFNDAFIEVRRSGLEEFLRRCFLKPQLVQKGMLLLTFLDTPDKDMEATKKSFESRNVADMCKDYKQAFAQDLSVLSIPDDDSKIEECKQFFEKHIKNLRDNMSVNCSKMVEHEQEQLKQIGLFQDRLTELAKEEDALLTHAGMASKPRMDLAAAFNKQKEFNNDGPGLMVVANEREADDAEAMQEALVSLASLQKTLQNLKKQVETEENEQRRLQDGTGGGHSSWLNFCPKR